MRQLIFVIFIVIGLSVSVSAQQCVDLADCENRLSQASQMLSKTLDALAAEKQAREALNAENEARKAKEQIDKAIIERQDKLIALLEKQTKRRLSIFFGLVKVQF